MITLDDLQSLEEAFKYGRVPSCFDLHDKNLEALSCCKTVLELLGGSCDNLELNELEEALDKVESMEKSLAEHDLDDFDDAIEIVKKYNEIEKIVAED